MSIQKFSLFMLGLALAALPAGASINYNATTQTSFVARAQATDGLLLSSLGSFAGSGTIAEYDDVTTGLEFFALKSDGVTADTLSVSGGILSVSTGADVIKVVFTNPATDAVGFNFTSVLFDNLCFDTVIPGPCASGGTTNPGFISAINDGPLAALPTLFLHPQSGSPLTQLQSFEVGTQGSATPEASTLLLIGSGLIALSAISINRRRRVRA